MANSWELTSEERLKAFYTEEFANLEHRMESLATAATRKMARWAIGQLYVAHHDRAAGVLDRQLKAAGMEGIEPWEKAGE